jgi:16S rRNA (guanine527-N7)-methyltransferase
VARLGDPHAPTAVTDPSRAWRVHVADSLAGLGFAELRAAERIADVGSGAGFPGLVLAAALPHAEVDLIESVVRKCDWIRAAARDCAIANARAMPVRAEEWAREGPPGGGREAYAAVTARAVGRLATLAELASPLLAPGGVLVAWKGRRDPVEEAEMARAAREVAMEPVEVRRVGPYVGSRNRHLHLMRKAGPTPPRLPRRSGMAKKRPFGTE